MGTLSPYQTLVDIRNAIIADSKTPTASNLVTQIDRWINEGYENLCNRKKRKWLDTQVTVQLNAKVQATCTVTENSSTVTFESGTVFPSGVELQFWNQGYEEVYDVTSATLNVVTLAKPYLGTTNTAATGIVFQKSIILDETVREVFQVYHQHDFSPLVNVGPQQMRSIQEARGPQFDSAKSFTIFGITDNSQRLLLYPYPDTAYTLYLDVNILPTMLVDDDDEPFVPMKFRQILYWYGLYKLWLFRKEDTPAATALANYNSLTSQMDGEYSPTLDNPQIIVSYNRPTRRRSVPLFDPRIRDSD